ncbi:MAG: DUF4956 domain-containing protein [Candidatus Poribacteria bacterium]|nr:DUF4956 domain-containing protein [Candidatus Poribacteria bacterium]
MEFLNEVLALSSVTTIGAVILKLLLAFVLGVVIAAVYHWTHFGLAGKSFTDTLIILCMLIAVVMVVIGDSIALAFSLVGALSIIRFRTVVQDPRDIAFVFFSLAIGMAVGASDPAVAITGTFLISVIILALHRWHLLTSNGTGFTLTFKTTPDQDYEGVYRSIFRKYLVSDRLIDQEAKKSDTVEFAFYVKLKSSKQWLSFFQELSALEGITGVKMARN